MIPLILVFSIDHLRPSYRLDPASLPKTLLSFLAGCRERLQGTARTMEEPRSGQPRQRQRHRRDGGNVAAIGGTRVKADSKAATVTHWLP